MRVGEIVCEMLYEISSALKAQYMLKLFFVGNFCMVSSSFMHVAPVSFRNRVEFHIGKFVRKEHTVNTENPIQAWQISHKVVLV